jgi:hypothetical protein
VGAGFYFLFKKLKIAFPAGLFDIIGFSTKMRTALRKPYSNKERRILLIN